MPTEPRAAVTPVRTGLSQPPVLDFRMLQQQETVLILLNLAVMTGVVIFHALFRPVVGHLTLAAGIAITVRFAMQLGEAAFLNRPGALMGPRAIWWYSRLSIVTNIAFTVLVWQLSSGHEDHYAVLLVIPIIAAAFRLSVAGLAWTLVVVAGLTLGLMWMPDAGSPAIAGPTTLDEPFEATVVSLTFVVVAVLVRLIASQLWTREAELRTSIANLAATRDELVRKENLAAVGRLASAIAHEVRNPVSMIASAVASVRRADTAPNVRTELFDILSLESQRLERLTEDFLVYARQRPPQLRSCSLSDALGLVAGLVRPRAEQLGVAIKTESGEVPCDEAPILLDPFQIQQALLNLAVNALDAAKGGGAVCLSARADGKGAVFAIEDTGEAIAPGVVARLGEPFFTTKNGGTGLGLAIARTIARAHGGEVVLAENKPGKVRFELTVHTAATVAA
jgi:two-component system, NtrC family, sensor histidine kinase HydH